MTWIDGAALGVIVLSAVFSMVRGFVREALSILAWVGAGLVALRFYPPVEPYVASVLPEKSLVVFVAIGLVFIVTLIVFSLLAALLGGLVRDSPLSGVDRTLGLLFGAARGALLVCLAYIALSVSVAQNDWPAPLVRLVPDPYKPKVDPLPTATVLSASPVAAPTASSALGTE
jgi:membrane protein required for colicin V production